MPAPTFADGGGFSRFGRGSSGTAGCTFDECAVEGRGRTLVGAGAAAYLMSVRVRSCTAHPWPSTAWAAPALVPRRCHRIQPPAETCLSTPRWHLLGPKPGRRCFECVDCAHAAIVPIAVNTPEPRMRRLHSGLDCPRYTNAQATHHFQGGRGRGWASSSKGPANDGIATPGRNRGLVDGAAAPAVAAPQTTLRR